MLLFFFFFCLVWRIDQALKKKKMQGGKAEKEMKEGEKEQGVRGKGCRPFSGVCLAALCEGTEEEVGGDGGGA